MQVPRRFVILAAPRTGSNMLCSLLGSHPDILCHHELFNPAGMYYALPLRNTQFQLARSTLERDQDPLGFLDTVWQTPLAHACVGFKMTYQQNPTVFSAVLAAPDIKKIILRRENAVKSYVSKIVAEHCGIWESYLDAPVDEMVASDSGAHQPPRQSGLPAKDLQFEIALDQLQHDIAFNARYYGHIESVLRDTQQDFLQVHYEELQEKATQAALLRYLSCIYRPLSAQSRKQNPPDLRQRVKNFDQLLLQCKNENIRRQLCQLQS